MEEQFREDADNVSVTQSLINLSVNSSASRLRTIEANLFHKHGEKNLEDYKTKIQSLRCARKEAIKIRDELLMRNKINATNMESLFQCQSQMYNYKSVLKSDYVNAQEIAKRRKIKYEEITGSYKIKWDRTEQEYLKLPMAAELASLQEESEELNKEAVKLADLLTKTRVNYFTALDDLKRNIMGKIIEFVKEIQTNLKLELLHEEIRKKKMIMEKLIKELRDREDKNKGTSERVHFLKPTVFPLVSQKEKQREKDQSSLFVDLAALDTVIIPPGILEVQNDEDAFFDSERSAMQIEPENHNPESEFTNENYLAEERGEKDSSVGDQNQADEQMLSLNETVDSSSIRNENSQAEANDSFPVEMSDQISRSSGTYCPTEKIFVKGNVEQISKHRSSNHGKFRTNKNESQKVNSRKTKGKKNEQNEDIGEELEFTQSKRVKCPFDTKNSRHEQDIPNSSIMKTPADNVTSRYFEVPKVNKTPKKTSFGEDTHELESDPLQLEQFLKLDKDAAVSKGLKITSQDIEAANGGKTESRLPFFLGTEDKNQTKPISSSSIFSLF